MNYIDVNIHSNLHCLKVVINKNQLYLVNNELKSCMNLIKKQSRNKIALI